MPPGTVKAGNDADTQAFNGDAGTIHGRAGKYKSVPAAGMRAEHAAALNTEVSASKLASYRAETICKVASSFTSATINLDEANQQAVDALNSEMPKLA